MILKEIGIASGHLSLTGWRSLIGMYALERSLGQHAPTFTEIAHCYGLHPYNLEGNGWWCLACWDKHDGEPLITELPTFNKEWKKIWFVAGGK